MYVTTSNLQTSCSYGSGLLDNDVKLKKNDTNITAKAAMQDCRAIAQNKFEKYKTNTEKAKYENEKIKNPNYVQI